MSKLWGFFLFVAIASLIANVLIWDKYSSSKPVVTVGSQKITVKDYRDALEFQDNGATIKKLVYESLVMQEADRDKCVPTDQDVQAKIAEIERKSPQILPDANTDPHRYQQFENDLKTDIALENIRIHDITVTPDEVKAFYANNPGAFILPTQVESTMVFTQTAMDAAIAEQDLREGLSDDVIGRQPRMHVVGVNNFSLNLNILPPGQREMIQRAMLGAEAGQVKTLAVGGAFLTFKIKANSKSEVPPLEKVYDQAVRDTKLSKARSPQEELAMIFQQHKPEFNNPTYEMFFLDAEHYDVPGSAQTH